MSPRRARGARSPSVSSTRKRSSRRHTEPSLDAVRDRFWALALSVRHARSRLAVYRAETETKILARLAAMLVETRRTAEADQLEELVHEANRIDAQRRGAAARADVAPIPPMAKSNGVLQ